MPVLALKDTFTARALGVMWNNYEQSLGIAPYLGRSFFGTDKKIGFYDTVIFDILFITFHPFKVCLWVYENMQDIRCFRLRPEWERPSFRQL